jgi:hypothetical protein
MLLSLRLTKQKKSTSKNGRAKTGQGNPGQAKTGQGNPGQAKTGQGNLAKAGQAKAVKQSGQKGSPSRGEKPHRFELDWGKEQMSCRQYEKNHNVNGELDKKKKAGADSKA